MGNMRVLPWVKLAVSVAALVAVVAAAFLVVHSRNDSGDLDKYFLRDAKAMQEMGLPVYWLGQEFTVDDLVFRGPYVAEFGAEVEGGGVAMTYLASVDGGNTALRLTMYSRDAWEIVGDRVTSMQTPGASRKTVSVAGHNGELLSAPGGARLLNSLRLILDFGNVVVVARANSGGATYPGGPDYNPFINNPDLLVQVMEDLRPYPE